MPIGTREYKCGTFIILLRAHITSEKPFVKSFYLTVSFSILLRFLHSTCLSASTTSL